MNSRQKEIKWPVGFDPSSSPVYVKNELHMRADPGQVWACLTRVITWPEWYPNASRVELINQRADQLQSRTKFRWKTFGVNLVSEVVDYVPNERIAWTALGPGVKAYHAWLIIPEKEGCHVITEETQHGWLCRLGKMIFPRRMHKLHQVWLTALEKKAVSDVMVRS